MALNQQLSDIHDQIEQSRIELHTFDFLRNQERNAIPRRLGVSRGFERTGKHHCDGDIFDNSFRFHHNDYFVISNPGIATFLDI